MLQYSLMDPTRLTEAEAAIMHARLNLRAGKLHLQEGLTAAGLASLYDALLFGMHYYIAGFGHCERINISSHDLWDHSTLYYKLAKAGVFDDPHAFNCLSLTVERALWQESFSFDVDSTLIEVERMLTKLGVIPSIVSSRAY